MSDPTRPRTVLAIADAWLKLPASSRLAIREISPQLAGNVERLSREIRRGSPVEIFGDDPIRQIEAERLATYLRHPLSRSHRVGASSIEELA